VCTDGKGCGLALYWREDLQVSLISFGNHHIDVRITDSVDLSWRCTFVYGEPLVQDRPEMWKLLRRIKHDVREPWLMIGDFNEAMWQHEHLSVSKRNEKQMQDFRDALSDCNLHDLGFAGVPWTVGRTTTSKKGTKILE
jgi:hypothetical protein